MKCDMIRDLLPGYIDGLTCETSNRAIEEHLRECGECRKYFEAMKKEMMPERYVEKTKKEVQEEIQPFKKIQKEMRKRAIIVALTVLLTVGILGCIYEWLYGGGIQAKAEDVKITYEKVNGVVRFNFLATDDAKYIDVLGGVCKTGENGKDISKWNRIQPVLWRISPFGNQKEPGHWGFLFLDEDTIMDKNGKTLELSGDEVLEIEFADGTKEIKIKDLYTEAGMQQLK